METNIKEYFNSTRAKTLGTVDKNGLTELCLCGTAFMPDVETIKIGNVCIDRTYENIKRGKKVTFLATKPTDPAYWAHYDKTGQKLYPAGYRIYCTFKKECNDQSEMQQVYERLKGIAGKRIADKLKSVIFFNIDAIREIRF